jgi:hypothetical protein
MADVRPFSGKIDFFRGGLGECGPDVTADGLHDRRRLGPGDGSPVEWLEGRAFEFAGRAGGEDFVGQRGSGDADRVGIQAESLLAAMVAQESPKSRRENGGPGASARP